MTITLPRLRFPRAALRRLRLLRVGAGRLFSSGSAGVLTACFLLFLLTAAVRPTRREWGVGAIPAALFAFSEPSAIRMIRRIPPICCSKRPNDAPRRGGDGGASPRRRSARSFCSFACSMRSARTRSPARPATQKEKRRLFWLCAGLIFAGSIPYLLLYAPGLNIYDTHDQILQFFGFPAISATAARSATTIPCF